MELLVVLIICWLVYDFIKISKRSKCNRQEYSSTPKYEPLTQEFLDQIDEAIDPDFKGKYKKRYLLTKNEYSEYKKLKDYASKRNLLICPKVRLLDLIEPRRGDPKYKTLFYKIQSKHVDFVLCDQNLYIKAILELDDNSHNQADREKRDRFVDAILTDVGYKVIRTKSITETTLDII